MSSASAATAQQSSSNININSSAESLSVCFAGHISSGKSTLVGHLCLLIDHFTARQFHAPRTLAADLGKSSRAFAFLLDRTRNEQERGITMENHTLSVVLPSTKQQEEDKTTTKPNETENVVTFVDVPSHHSYMKSCASGLAMANALVLVVSAAEGEFESSFTKNGGVRSHLLMAHAMGITKVIVVVNKMDEPTHVNYCKQRFDEIVDEVTAFLRKLGFGKQLVGSSSSTSSQQQQQHRCDGSDDKSAAAAASGSSDVIPIEFIPISALTGENIVSRERSRFCLENFNTSSSSTSANRGGSSASAAAASSSSSSSSPKFDHSNDKTGSAATNMMPWYTGPTLLEAIQNLQRQSNSGSTTAKKTTTTMTTPKPKPKQQPFRAFVNCAYPRLSRPDFVIVEARISSGKLRVGDTIVFARSQKTGRVSSIELNNKPLPREAALPGDVVGVCVQGVAVGDIFEQEIIGHAFADPPAPIEIATLSLVVLQHPNRISAGYAPVFDVATQHVPVRITALVKRIDRSTGATLEEDPRWIKQGDTAIVTVAPVDPKHGPIVLEAFANVPSLGRIVLRDMRFVVGVASVKEVEFGKTRQRMWLVRKIAWLIRCNSSGRAYDALQMFNCLYRVCRFIAT